MWVISRRSDGQVVAFGANADLDMEKQIALEAAVSGLTEHGEITEYEATQVRDRVKASVLMDAKARGARLSVSAKGKVVIKEPERSLLTLTSDVESFHPVDSIPLIPANGKSFATVIVQKIDERGNPRRRQRDSDRLWLRTDQGTIRDPKGRDLHELKLRKGRASFRLYSGPERRVATVWVLSPDSKVENAYIRIEFI